MMFDKEGVISVWLGTSHKSMEDFNQYTDGMESQGANSAILQDFAVGFVDSDMFGAYGTAGNEVVPVEELCRERGCNSVETLQAVVAACKEQGIHVGNSLYYYGNHEFVPEEQDRLYNDLYFVGVFSDPKKKPRKSK